MLVIGQRLSDLGILLRSAQSECVVRLVGLNKSPLSANLSFGEARGYVEFSSHGKGMRVGDKRTITINGHEVEVSVQRIESGKIRIGFDADVAVVIKRLELL